MLRSRRNVASTKVLFSVGLVADAHRVRFDERYWCVPQAALGGIIEAGETRLLFGTVHLDHVFIDFQDTPLLGLNFARKRRSRHRTRVDADAARAWLMRGAGARMKIACAGKVLMSPLDRYIHYHLYS
jgi:hypothetical protein